MAKRTPFIGVCLKSIYVFVILGFLAGLIVADPKSPALPPKMGGVIDAFNNDVFTLLTNAPMYKKHLPPQENRPIKVNISILLLGFGSIDESKTEFSLHLLLRIYWFDERLRPWNATVARGKPVTILEGGSWHLDRLWTPGIHVPNSKVPAILQDRTQNPVLTRIQSDGQILVSKRIILQGVSQMNFALYPVDVQAIDFEIESNELSHDNLQLFWRHEVPFDTDEKFVWNGYDMIKYELQSHTVNYTHTGTFSRIVATFYLSRIFGQFLLDFYVPIFLYVIISWGSFWVEITAAPARVTLCVTTLLTMVTTAKSARDKLPPVTYLVALDIWINVCIFFVFSTTIEYTAVNYIYYKEKRSLLKKNKRLQSMRKRQVFERRHLPNSNSNSTLKELAVNHADIFNEKFTDPTATITSDDVNITIMSASSENFCISSGEDSNSSSENGEKGTFLQRVLAFLGRITKAIRKREEKRKYGRGQKQMDGCEEIAYEIDRLSRIAFPTLFLVFNIIYWLVLVVASSRWSP